MSEWTSSAERFLEQARADDDAAEEGALMNEQPSFADVDAYIAGLEGDAMAPLAELLQPHPDASRLDATVPIEAIDPTHPDHYERDWCSRGFCDCRSAVSS